MALMQTWVLFAAINLVACFLNHIDDTDEPYGYWEPFHYLLYGKGMQTWEYSPTFGIRTYSFVVPIWFLGRLFSLATEWRKIYLFYAIRAAIGLFSAYAKAKFVVSAKKMLRDSISATTALFLVLSPGIFYCGTSYLPSAVVTSMIMLSAADLMMNKHGGTIFWGCIAVLWSGWPFVGVILLPFGLYMLFEQYRLDSFAGVMRLIMTGVVILVVTGVPPVIMDYYLYGQVISPTVNILLYNAIGGSGDELYGVEPAIYYIKNLFLNLGLVWPLALVSPLATVLTYCQAQVRTSQSDLKLIVLQSSVGLWLLILFRRPHKEERFMYPVYPLLALIAAAALQSMLDIIDSTWDTLFPTITSANTTATKRKILASTSAEASDPEESSRGAKHVGQISQSGGVGGESEKSARRDSSETGRSTLSRLLLLGVCLVSAAIGASRVASNHNNYGGYLKLWTSLSTHLSTSPHSLAHANANADCSANSKSDSAVNAETRVCTGGEWYLFPSHFFLPDHARLEFVEDNFHGLLPQYFAAVNGTKADTGDAFNDRNTEDKRRYIDLQLCDYVVTHVSDELLEAIKASREGWKCVAPTDSKGSSNRSSGSISSCGGSSSSSSGSGSGSGISDRMDDRFSPLQRALLESQSLTPANSPTSKSKKRFELLLSERVIDSDKSASSLARAFFIPKYSPAKNAFRLYAVFAAAAEE